MPPARLVAHTCFGVSEFYLLSSNPDVFPSTNTEHLLCSIRQGTAHACVTSVSSPSPLVVPQFVPVGHWPKLRGLFEDPAGMPHVSFFCLSGGAMASKSPKSEGPSRTLECPVRQKQPVTRKEKKGSILIF